MPYFAYWGKRGRDRDIETFHPLVYHGLDVAACARELLVACPGLQRSLTELTGMAKEELERLVCWLAALHDIGKFSSFFQHLEAGPAQREHLADQGIDWDYLDRRSLGKGKAQHSPMGWSLWLMELAERLHLEQPAVASTMLCATGHHGRPPSHLFEGSVFNLDAAFTAEDRAAAARWAEDVTRMFAPAFPSRTAAKACSLWLAGFLTLADWIGSDLTHFPYEMQRLTLDAYWTRATHQAAAAIEAAGITGRRARRSFSELFPFTPTPMQQAVIDLGLSDEAPYLLVIEETTGGGKTEAALHAAGGRQLFFALPSMATANNLYARLPALGGQQALIHGKSWLLPESMQRASSWLRSNNRKALLADIGAGTVDQAMLAALRTKFNTLRLIGLAGKTLIIDELHAYDAYMKPIIESLIQLHSRAGGSVVLLSATLPLAFREDYVKAWCAGRSLAAPALTNTGFPLLTHINAKGQALERADIVSRYDLGSEGGRHVDVAFATGEDAVMDALSEVAAAGQCAVWIRNTVAEAQEAYARLKARGHKVSLFHSRYTVADRAEREREVCEVFGKEAPGTSKESLRRGQILVATQVVEQSLDLDFDFMVSDLCPIDLLVQRMGRLYRHTRSYRIGLPTLLLHSPAYTLDPSPAWLNAWGTGTAAVYPDHGRLWLTLDLVREGVTLPGDSRRLIEGVYGPAADAKIPKGLQAISKAAREDEKRDATDSLAFVVTSATAYEASGYVVSDKDDTAATRKAERSQTWVVYENGHPLNGDQELSSLRLAASQLASVEGKSVTPEKVDEAQVLGLVNGRARGRNGKGKVVELVYEKSTGLSMQKA